MSKENLREDITLMFRDVLDKLGIGPMDVFVFFQDEVEYDKAKDAYDDHTLGVIVEYPYLIVDLYVPEKWTKMKEEEPARFWEDLLHEGFHVLFWKFSEIAHDRHARAEELRAEEEHLCDHLANIFRGFI